MGAHTKEYQLLIALGWHPSSLPPSGNSWSCAIMVTMKPHWRQHHPGPLCLMLGPFQIPPQGPAQLRGPALPSPLHGLLSLSLASLWPLQAPFICV
jgi:hypothetical protein